MTQFQPTDEAVKSALRNILDCECAFCGGLPIVPAISARILEAFERRLRSGQDVRPEAPHALRMLARSREPVQGLSFQRSLEIDERSVKDLMRELRNDWLLPICATRQKPFGYFVASGAEDFLDWMRTTRNQAISELAVAHKLFRTNFPELAGQQSFDFIHSVTVDLQEAIR